MRFALMIGICVAAAQAAAQEVMVDTDVTAVTLHPQFAVIQRAGAVELPAGRHQLIVQGLTRFAIAETLRLDLPGADVVSLTVAETTQRLPEPSDPASQAAITAVEDLEDQIEAIEDAAAAARGEAQAWEDTLAYLRRLGTSETAAPTADEVRETARLIASESAAASAAAAAARIEARRIEDPLEELRRDLAAAIATRDALLPDPERETLSLGVEVQVDTPITADLDLSYLVQDAAEWTAGYDFHLETEEGSAEGQLRIERHAMVTQSTGEIWQDIALTLSTHSALEAVATEQPRPLPMRIEEPAPALARAAPLAEPAMVEDMIVEDSGAGFAAEGSEFTYAFPEPVTLYPGSPTLRLEIAPLTSAVTVEAHAVPLTDRTAYRMVELVNTFGQELIEAYSAIHHVNGEIVGTSWFEGLVPGEAGYLGFGEIDSLRLRRDTLEQNEGDRGFIVRDNQRIEAIEIEIDNIGTADWTVRLFDRVPYATQEDLEISWTASPAPDEEDVDKARGVLAWDLDVAAGTQSVVLLETDISWPEGMVLR